MTGKIVAHANKNNKKLDQFGLEELQKFDKEITKDAQKTLPWVLITGTSIVTLVYLALNYSFLYTAPIEDMAGEVEVGAIAARAAFGEVAGGAFGAALALLIISTVSAMTMAGPRVIQVIGEDFPRLKFREASRATHSKTFLRS